MPKRKKRVGRPRSKNPSQKTIYLREWYEKNPEKMKEYSENKKNKIAGNVEKRVSTLVNLARGRCKKNGREFDVTGKDYLPAPSVCRYLEGELGWANTTRQDNSPTIDRIDPTKGYTKENTIIISKRANRIKNNATLEELERLCRNLRALMEERGLL